MSESPLTLAETDCNKKVRERNKRKRKIPTKGALQHLCEEEIDVSTYSPRAQEWLGQLQAEYVCRSGTVGAEILSGKARIDPSPVKDDNANACSSNVDNNQITIEALALHYIEEMKFQRSDFYPKCKICNKMFSNSTNLLVHYRSHAGIKPFTCSICSASFSRRQSLQHHEMCHNDQSLYACPKCDAKFRHRSHFKDHLRKHTDNNAFCCDVCQQCFGSRSTLRRHVIKVHAG